MANNIREIIIVISTILISSCYPMNKTIQPHAEIVVVDERINPVSDAVVTLIAGAYPYGEKRNRMNIKTDDSGKVGFPKIKDWRIEALLIHGSESYYRSWCVYKKGYVTYKVGTGGLDGFNPRAHVILQAGTATLSPSILQRWETGERP